MYEKISKFSTNLADLLADLAPAKEGCSFNGALALAGNLLNPSTFVSRKCPQSFRPEFPRTAPTGVRTGGTVARHELQVRPIAIAARFAQQESADKDVADCRRLQK